MQKILDRLKRKLIGVINTATTIDGLVNLDLGKLLFGLSDSDIENSLAPSVGSSESVRRPKIRRLRKRANKGVKITPEIGSDIKHVLEPLTVGSEEYIAERNRLGKKYELSPKQVSGVLQGHKGWSARQAKMKAKKHRVGNKK